MFAIAKREFAGLFNNVVGWLFLAVNFAVFGLYFLLNNLMYGAPTISYTLSGLMFVFMITVPVLTMRILAEERKNKTDQLILTAPVSVYQIVAGKFLSLVMVFAIPVIVMGITPPILSIFGKVNYTDSYLALLGFFLYGLTALAIGLFISSLTESQVIAAVASFILLFIGYMMSTVTENVFSNSKVIAKVLGCYDLRTPYEDMLGASLNLISIVYYCSLILLFLFLTVQSIEKRRWSISSRKLSGSVFSVGMIVCAIAVVIAANVFVHALPKSKTAFDLSTKKLYSITKKTKDFVKTIDDDITIYVMGTKSDIKDSYTEVSKSLDLYDDASRHIKVKYVDPQKNPTFGKKYDQDELVTGSLVVESGKRFTVISPDKLYETEVDYQTYSQTTTGYDGEGQITSALQYVTTEKMPVLYTLTGHDEIPLGEGFLEVIEKTNAETKDLNLLKNDAVPKDAEAVIINAPQSDFSRDDVKKLKKYMDGGGQMFVALEFMHNSDLKNVKALLEKFKVRTVDGVVADFDSDYYYQNPFYLFPNVESTDVTTELSGEASVFAPYSVGLRFPSDNEKYEALMKTSKDSVSKEGFDSAEDLSAVEDPSTQIKKESGDEEGPFTIGLSVQTKKEGRLFVFGSTYIFTDNADQMVSYRNSKLFSNVVSAMLPSENDSSTIVIPVKKYDNSTLTVTTGAMRIYGLLFIIVIPIGCLIAGLVIFFTRRRR